MNHNQLLSLRVNNKLLRENVDVSPLVPILLANNVIREEHVSIVDRGLTRQEKAKLFFENVLIKKGYGVYWRVIRGLRQSRQGDIADILENTVCDSPGDLPRDRLRKRRRIIFKLTRNPDADEATSATEERIINFLHKQCQSTDPSSLRENILKRYSFFVEQIEPIPVCIVALSYREDKLAQFDRDVTSGEFKIFVLDCLAQLGEYRQFQRTWDINVSVEREQLPEGAVEEEDSDEEYEDPASGLLQSDSASGGLVLDPVPTQQSSEGSLQTDGSIHHSIEPYLDVLWRRHYSTLERRRNVLHYLADAFCTDGCDSVIEQAKRRSVLLDIINQQELYLGAEQCFLVRGLENGQYAWHYVIVDRGQLTIFKMVTNRGQVDVGKYGTIIMSGWGLAPPQETVDQIAKRYDPTIVREGAKPDMAPLHYSIIRENDALSTKLIQNGADVNLKDSFGLTPLHLAAMRGQLFIVKQLEAHGADLDARDNKQRRPLEIAEANRQTQVANYLRSARDINKCRNFVQRQLPNVMNELKIDSLEDMGTSGQDVRHHVVQHLRDLESMIHDQLYDLGTTPVMQETPGSPFNPQEAVAVFAPVAGNEGGNK